MRFDLRSSRTLYVLALLSLGVTTAAVTLPKLMASPAGPPDQLSEVVRRANELGLHCLDLGSPGSGIRALLVSTEPTSREAANGGINLANPAARFWTGRLYVVDPGESRIQVLEPRAAAAWGRLFVAGDPGLIERVGELN